MPAKPDHDVLTLGRVGLITAWARKRAITTRVSRECSSSSALADPGHWQARARLVLQDLHGDDLRKLMLAVVESRPVTWIAPLS
jgi:hypothetical protein